MDHKNAIHQRQAWRLPLFAAALLGIAFLLAQGHVFSASAQNTVPIPESSPIRRVERQPLDNRISPWSAIGHVNVGGYRKRTSCTGTLIAPGRVLTAAHCVINPKSGRKQHLKDIHFVTGISPDGYLEHSPVKCVLTPKYIQAVKRNASAAERLRADIAILILQRELKAKPMPTRIEDISPDTHLLHPSYPAAQRYFLSADPDCRLKSKTEGLWITNCDTNKGSSGGPLMTKEDDQPAVTGVVVALTPQHNSIAIPLTNYRDLLQQNDCGSASGD